MKKIAEDAKEVLVNKSGAGNDFLGWIDLPVDYDKDEFARIKAAAKKIQEFLKSKLNADDYFTAEEMLNDLIAETEEKGFAAGAKYTAGLGMELFAE